MNYVLYMQVGFGLYPVIVKQFAAEQKANPIIFSFYRQVLIHTESSAYGPSLASQPPFTVGLAREASEHTGALCLKHLLFSRFHTEMPAVFHYCFSVPLLLNTRSLYPV